MATVTLFLRRGKTGITVLLRYRHKNTEKRFGTGVRVLPEEWNQKSKAVDFVKGKPDAKYNTALIQRLKLQSASANAKIDVVKSTIQDIVNRLQYKGIEPFADVVYREYQEAVDKPKEMPESNVVGLFKQFINDRVGSVADSTIRQYKSSLTKFEHFYNSLKVKPKLLPDLDFDFYTRYIQWLAMDQGLSRNSIGNRVKVFKTFLIHYRDKGYKISDVKKMKVFKESGNIIYLYQNELQELYEYDFSKNVRLTKVRDLFCLACTTGLRFSDLSRLGTEHIQNGAIDMKAFKNRKRIYIPLIDMSKSILDKYSIKDGETIKYQLPKISEQKYNKYLKEACGLAGLNRPIEVSRVVAGKKIYTKEPLHNHVSSHIAVKTFITHCIEKKIEPKMVAIMTGKSVKVLIDSYYGTSDLRIRDEMSRAFGNTSILKKA